MPAIPPLAVFPAAPDVCHRAWTTSIGVVTHAAMEQAVTDERVYRRVMGMEARRGDSVEREVPVEEAEGESGEGEDGACAE